MERETLTTYVCLFMVSCLHGAPFKHSLHMGDANTDSKLISKVDCSEYCSFVITESSLSDAQKNIVKFLNLQKSMLIYVNIDTQNLILCPDDDQQKQNQIREWQWIMSKNSWYINLPIDLDYASFHVTYSGESRIRLKIEAIESNRCSVSDVAIEQVRNLLWSELFTNKSGSLLCNRYFDHQDWKSIFYAFTTVWIGYDLLCIAPTIDKSYHEKSHAAASVLTPLFCFFIALYHPLVNKIIESRYIKRQLKEEKPKGKMELYDYIKGDKPFGYERVVLKCFFSEGCANYSPAIKLNIVYFVIYLIFSTVPMMLEYHHDKEELEDFGSIYKLGLPVFHYWKMKKIGYVWQITITIALLLLMSFANLWYFYEFSESTDFLVFLKFPTVANNMNKENTICGCNRWTFSEDVDNIIEILKTRKSNYKRLKKVRRGNKDRKIAGVKTVHKVKPVENSSNRTSSTIEPVTIDVSINNFYAKFIKRFTLLFSLVFWKYIFDLSTKIIDKSQSKSNAHSRDKPCGCNIHCLVWVLGLIFVFPINFILIILTCAFPVFWFAMLPFLKRIKNVLSCLGKCFCKAYQKCKQKKSTEKKHLLKKKNLSNEQTKKPKDMDSTSERNEPTMVEEKRSTCLEIILLTFDIPCVFLLYHQFSVVVLILRSLVYILFIAITNYDHLLRIFIVLTSCFAYLGVFIATFIDRYAAILKIIFDEFETNICKAQKSPNEKTEKETNSEECAKKEKKLETVFISEKCFDYVIDHCYAVREHFFVVIFKVVITIMFFILSLAVLLQSNIFDSTTKLTNIIDFVFIVVTPSVLFKFFDKDEQEIINDHERDIRQRTNDFYKQDESEEETDEEGLNEDTDETRIKVGYKQQDESEKEANEEELKEDAEETRVKVDSKQLQDEELKEDAEETRVKVNSKRLQDEELKEDAEETNVKVNSKQLQDEELKKDTEETRVKVNSKQLQDEELNEDAEETRVKVNSKQLQDEELKEDAEETSTKVNCKQLQEEELKEDAEETRVKVNCKQVQEEELKEDAEETRVKVNSKQLQDEELKKDTVETSTKVNCKQLQKEELKEDAEETRVKVNCKQVQEEELKEDAEETRVKVNSKQLQDEELKKDAEETRVKVNSKQLQDEELKEDAEETRVKVNSKRLQDEELKEDAEETRVKVNSKQLQDEELKKDTEETRVKVNSKQLQDEELKEDAEETRVKVNSKQLQDEELKKDAEETSTKINCKQLQEEESKEDTEETRSFEGSCSDLNDSLFMSCRSHVSHYEGVNEGVSSVIPKISNAKSRIPLKINSRSPIPLKIIKRLRIPVKLKVDLKLP